jgi:hypothetical protein
MAVKRYLDKWYSETQINLETKQKVLDIPIDADGIVKAVGSYFSQHVHGGTSYDKMGVLQEVMLILQDYFEQKHNSNLSESIDALRERLTQFSMSLKRLIELSRREARSTSTAQAIKRSIDDFFKRYKESCNSFDLQLLLERCSTLAKYIGEDARRLTDTIDVLLEKAHAVRAADIAVISNDNWIQWATALRRIRENPLNPESEGSLLEHATDEPPAQAVSNKATSAKQKEIKKSSSDSTETSV